MRQFSFILALLFLIACVQPAYSQCTNSPTPAPTATATATLTPTPAPTFTPFAGNWLKIIVSGSWLNDNTDPGYSETYFATLNEAPFPVTFTHDFTGQNPTAFSILFDFAAGCVDNGNGSITIAVGRGCAWWILTDDTGVSAIYWATTMSEDPGNVYSVSVSH